jgi:tRNA U34 5-methylaminomethyl-2-thiouridine-forming methyltransferase MnmC
MIRTVKKTLDQSNTIFLEELNETYHSINGALDESLHVYIQKGFNEAIKIKNTIHVFEVGFGTGLNTILTLIEAHKKNITCTYHSIEAFPLEENLVAQLNYTSLFDEKYHQAFEKIHQAKWNETIKISNNFLLNKIHSSLENYQPILTFDVIYFDAFAPDKQPELWTETIFKKMFDLLNENGILVTYSAKGEVRRTLQRVGFTVERTNGPKGKREMLQAKKILSITL